MQRLKYLLLLVVMAMLLMQIEVLPGFFSGINIPPILSMDFSLEQQSADNTTLSHPLLNESFMYVKLLSQSRPKVNSTEIALKSSAVITTITPNGTKNTTSLETKVNLHDMFTRVSPSALLFMALNELEVQKANSSTLNQSLTSLISAESNDLQAHNSSEYSMHMSIKTALIKGDEQYLKNASTAHNNRYSSIATIYSTVSQSQSSGKSENRVEQILTQPSTINTSNTRGTKRKNYVISGPAVGVVRDHKVTNSKVLSINTTYCKMLDLNPWPKELVGIIKATGKYNCKGQAPMEEVKMTKLRVREDRVKILQWKHKGKVLCYYDEIVRKGDNSFRIIKLNKLVGHKYIPINEEFIKLTCKVNKTKDVYQNFIPFIHEKPDIPKDPRKPHVLIILIDSVSRYNMVRKLPKTYATLASRPGFFDFKGHTKVAENTFVNILPMLGGKFLAEVYNNSFSKTYLDYLPLIWKDFRKSGYLTLYQEDRPLISTFNYNKKGFSEPPTDYYMRPFILGANDKKNSMNRNNKKDCYNKYEEVEVMLDYIIKFLQSSEGTPKFALSITNGLSHDNINSLGYADQFYQQFFKSFFKLKISENAFVFFLSDHGIRFGSIRTTFMGKIEERLPMFLLVPPSDFRSKYSTLSDNLDTNTKALTTHFDIYWTLKDILSFPNIGRLRYDKNDKGRSLFIKVSDKRSCESEHIAPHWCVCSIWVSLNTTNSYVLAIAQDMLRYINEKTSHLEMCKKWILKKVISVYETGSRNILQKVANLKKKTKKKIYYYLITVKANSGIFESTVVVDKRSNNFIFQDVSRIDSYVKTSRCLVKYAKKTGQNNLLNYCLCAS